MKMEGFGSSNVRELSGENQITIRVRHLDFSVSYFQISLKILSTYFLLTFSPVVFRVVLGSFIRSFLLSFIPSFIHSFIHSVSHSFIRSFFIIFEI